MLSEIALFFERFRTNCRPLLPDKSNTVGKYEDIKPDKLNVVPGINEDGLKSDKQREDIIDYGEAFHSQ